MSSSKDSIPASIGARRDGSRPGSLPSSGNTAPLIRIPVNLPAPDEWTLVREVNMEKREPCEIWRSGVIHQLHHMREQLLKFNKVLEDLDEELLSQEVEQ